MKFKEWLKIREVATTTASIATYAMPIGATVRREPIPTLGFEDKKKKKKRKLI